MNATDISINGVNQQHLITGIVENDVIQTVSASDVNRGKYFVYVGKNKSVTISFANHAGYQNALYQANLTLISGTNYSQSLGDYVNFTGNNSATIHTEEYEYVMFQCDYQTAYTATFTDISDDIKLVDGYQLDTNLTSVANAIRTKSGGSSSLAFPSGFISEIGNIPTGGGGSTKAGVSMFMIESGGSYTMHVSYATIGNPYCIDEDGNTYDGSNGKFQYASWNGGTPNNWIDLGDGDSVNKPYPITVLRFLNTDNNKPFICCSSYNDFTGDDYTTELYINNVSGNFRYGPVELKPVPDSVSTTTGAIWGMYSASIGLNYQFDWLIAQEMD